MRPASESTVRPWQAFAGGVHSGWCTTRADTSGVTRPASVVRCWPRFTCRAVSIRPELFESVRPTSSSTASRVRRLSEFRDLPNILGVVENGIALEKFPFTAASANEDYLLWMGRICPEKGTHLALDVARRLAMKLVLAGSVYPFTWHREYFAREILPRLAAAGPMAEFIESPPFARKLELLSRARALLIPTLAPETSSLVAIESMACGTPVVALRRGALPEVVADGTTGFLVNDFDEMTDAVRRVDVIGRRDCRARVEARFSSVRMADGYERLYAAIPECAIRLMRTVPR